MAVGGGVGEEDTRLGLKGGSRLGIDSHGISQGGATPSSFLLCCVWIPLYKVLLLQQDAEREDEGRCLHRKDQKCVEATNGKSNCRIQSQMRDFPLIAVQRPKSAIHISFAGMFHRAWVLGLSMAVSKRSVRGCSASEAMVAPRVKGLS
jgi:hypothetical protein